jgi:hypothetical protein
VLHSASCDSLSPPQSYFASDSTPFVLHQLDLFSTAKIWKSNAIEVTIFTRQFLITARYCKSKIN